MQIIDHKNKDYYDYIAHQYRDKTTTYDRRGSIVVDDNYLVWFIASHGCWHDKLPREVPFFLETGNVQYLITLTKLEYKNPHISDPSKELLPSDINLKNCDIKLIFKYDECKHYLSVPMSISRVWMEVTHTKPSYCRPINRLNEFGIPSDFKQFTIQKSDKISADDFISNPILKKTKIPSIIEPSEINRNLENYFSEFYRDKTIEAQMSNKEKIISKGFDPVSSFRNIK